MRPILSFFVIALYPFAQCFLLVRATSEDAELLSRKLQAEALKVKIRLAESGIAATKKTTLLTHQNELVLHTQHFKFDMTESPPVTQEFVLCPLLLQVQG